jgi:hypothetical protein
MAFLASATLGKRQSNGSIIIPDSARFTLRFGSLLDRHIFMQNTYPTFLGHSNCHSISVTVSIAADTIGTLSVIFLENFV